VSAPDDLALFVDRVEETAGLELVTPAFLAGPGQRPDDCDLRPAALRDTLRWWWRTLHTGSLSPRQLALLESALWGDTKSSGAIRILVTPAPENPPPEWFDDKSRFRTPPAIDQPDPPTAQTTQGLFYLVYGMDGRGREGRQPRCARPPGCRWQVTVWARPVVFVEDPESSPGGLAPELPVESTAAVPEQAQQGKAIPAAEVLDQALAALWLLGHFGGVGSKSRNGFGSFRVQFGGWREPNLVDCLEFGRALRQRLGLPQEVVPRQAESPSLADPQRGLIELTTDWTDPWAGLGQIGLAYQAFARKHDPTERPRSPRPPHKPRRPGPTAFGRQDPADHGLPPWLLSPGVGHDEQPRDDRLTSPIHIHLSRGEGGLTVRVLTFPAARSPDRTTGAGLLKKFLQFLRQELSVTGRSTRRGRRPPPVS
jgi:CRISPR-associated protein Cmr6